MRLKLISIDEKQLKDYLILVQKIKNFPPDKTAEMVGKMTKMKGRVEKKAVYRNLIESNLKNVVHAASRYRGAGVTFAALIAAGNRALIAGIRGYDAEKDENFNEVINWHIEGAIMDCVLQAIKEVKR
jgi:DNA-directed RNA polymerase sigma subunit (sigma70/sigma32)